MSKKKTLEEIPETLVYPQYISNHPKGEDLFEGKSQERLAMAIAAHIEETDSCKTSTLSRLIGLEGKWGSGKSNAIQILEDKLKGSYTFFTFDAWGNQEDLQRRSILELLTNHLLEQEKLTGKTTMKVMKPEGEGKVEVIDCTWKEKLESLLSRKSYSRDITVPSFSNSTKWFILSLLVMGLVIAYLAVQKTCIWWIDILIAVSPMILFTLGMLFSGSSWKKMFAMYNTEGKSDTTSYVISEQEPSVREFKDWMNELSNGLPKDDKLVLVFDNMDRLPSEKVHQFWSLIQTFFAGKDYNNIWCIIPYDEEHLASAFSDSEGEDEQHKLLRCFLDKTFSVVYRVPEPIVSDYKQLFTKLLDLAYSDTIPEEEKELISRCYRHLHPAPNVREIISFINRTVTLRKQWNDAVHSLSIVIFALREYELLHHPYIEIVNSGKKNMTKVSTEEYILSGEFYKGLPQLLLGEDFQKYIKKEISALVYGIEPQDALQIVIKRYIRNCFTDKAQNANLNAYVDNPQFVSMLDEEIHDMDTTVYTKAVTLIDKIDEDKLSEESKAGMAEIWRFFGQQYIRIPNKPTNFGEYESIVFSHLSEELAQMCSKTFCERILNNIDVTGDNLFIQLEALFNSDFAKSFDISKTCPTFPVGATRFLDYVEAAGEQYGKYPLCADSEELNKTLISNIGDSFRYFEALQILKEDDHYKVNDVADYSVSELNKKTAKAPVAYNLIRIQKLFFDKFKSQLDNSYITTLWQEVQSDPKSHAYEEIYALKASTVLEQLPEDDRHVSLLYDNALFYTTTTKLLKDVIANRAINCRKKLVQKMVKDCRHDGNPDYPEFIQNWENLRVILGVSHKEIIMFADAWGVNTIPESKTSEAFFALVNVSWMDALVANETPISKSLLEKCASELISQRTDQFVQSGTQNHTGNEWDTALTKLINTDYISSSNMGTLNRLAEYILDYVARNGQTSDACWTALLQKVDYANISASVGELKNKILNQQSGYGMNSAKFIALNKWLKLADIDSRRTDAANSVLGKVVDNAECQNIILADKEYYAPMISETVETASELHLKLKAIIDGNGESEFVQYVKGMICPKQGAQES